MVAVVTALGFGGGKSSGDEWARWREVMLGEDKAYGREGRYLTALKKYIELCRTAEVLGKEPPVFMFMLSPREETIDWAEGKRGVKPSPEEVQHCFVEDMRMEMRMLSEWLPHYAELHGIEQEWVEKMFQSGVVGCNRRTGDEFNALFGYEGITEAYLVNSRDQVAYTTDGLYHPMAEAKRIRPQAISSEIDTGSRPRVIASGLSAYGRSNPSPNMRRVTGANMLWEIRDEEVAALEDAVTLIALMAGKDVGRGAIRHAMAALEEKLAERMLLEDRHANDEREIEACAAA